MPKKKDEIGVKSPSRTGDHAKFIRLRNKGLPVGQAKKMSGFARGYATSRILKAKASQQVLRTIEDQRNQLVTAPGTSLIDCVDHAQAVRDNPKISPSAQLQANKQIIDIAGYNAPTQIESKSMSLVMEYHKYDVDQLQEIINQL